MNKIISAHQPAYLPWLGYLHKIAISDDFIILDEVQFERNSFINRNRIKTSSGPVWLSVPVLMSGHTRSTVSQMRIDNTADWKQKHWKSILQNYRKTKYFPKYADFFEGFYKREWSLLCEPIDYMLKFLLEQIGINTPVHKLSHLLVSSKKQDLILDLAKYFKADVFIFGALGKDYVDKTYFSDNGIYPYFQDYVHPEYKQPGKNFLAGMSVIDLLFNMGNECVLEIIMSGNITKNEIKKLKGENNEKGISCCRTS